MEKERIKISVRNLVEFILRSGDLDVRKGTSADRKAMEKGSRIHRKIQKQMGHGYQAEVALSFLKDYDEFQIQIDGRADGILQWKEPVVIDEIKGVYRDLSFLEEPVEVHLAQAKCYAYIYGKKNKKERMGVQMTYCNLDTEEIRRFYQEYSVEKLEEWFEWLMDEYYQWELWRYGWGRKRNASMEGMEFPFPYREGQREVVTGVYRTLLRKKQLFLQAPTGVGKTMSTVFPAVRGLGEGLADKVFYLTARTVTGSVAKDAFLILKERGLNCKLLMITAKEKLCVLEEPECTPTACPRAKGHFDRVNEAVFHLLQEQDVYDREVLLEYSRRYQVCPYEMCLDLAVWVDGIICDYNYVFDPNVQLKRFFGEGNKGSYIFLIDEAHNLVERGRKMYSADLYKEDFQEMEDLVKSRHKKLAAAMEKCNRQFLILKRECDTYRVIGGLGGLSIALMNMMGLLEEYLEGMEEGSSATKILDFYFKVRHFMNMYDLLDDNYVIYTEHDPQGRFHVKLFCINPGTNLQGCLDKGVGAVFFSATLLPVNYYKKLLSGREDDYAIYAKTPFRPEQKRILIGRDVSSRYTRRGPEEYGHISEYLYQTVKARSGNYMVFFPSYQMMAGVWEVFQETYGEQCEKERIKIQLQSPYMKEEDREKFLEEFNEEREKGTSLAGFCVMGGIFSEGIDLTGEKLIGVVIVGTGIPQIGNEREILMKYYQDRGENGFDYAYKLPGINKVFQAAGRVIRTVADRGVILLLDERFCSPDYRMLFPREWEDYVITTRTRVAQELKDFWKSGEESQ